MPSVLNAHHDLSPLTPSPPGGLPLALIILSLYFQRLILHHIPTQEMIVSSFLPIGPTGLAGFSLVKLGKVALTVLPAVDRTAGGDGGRAGLLAGGMYGSGVAGAVLMWGLGVSGWLSWTSSERKQLMPAWLGLFLRPRFDRTGS